MAQVRGWRPMSNLPCKYASTLSIDWLINWFVIVSLTLFSGTYKTQSKMNQHDLFKQGTRLSVLTARFGWVKQYKMDYVLVILKHCITHTRQHATAGNRNWSGTGRLSMGWLSLNSAAPTHTPLSSRKRLVPSNVCTAPTDMLSKAPVNSKHNAGRVRPGQWCCDAHEYCIFSFDGD